MIRKSMVLGFLALAAASASVPATAQTMQPYVLASAATGSIDDASQAVMGKLTAAGFTVVGEFSPYSGAKVIAVTNAEMQEVAAKSPYGGFGAVEHVALTQAGGQIQVSYLNLRYLAAAYRLTGDLSAVETAMESALGNEKTYGTEKGRSADDLSNYHYMLGMEHLDDFYKLGSHKSYEEAVKVVEANLNKHVGGTALVYKVEIPGKQQTVFGVSRAAVSDERANDKHIMQDTVDQKFDIKTTAYLPYQVMVDGKDVIAMNMRFRMAVWHPDLTMGTFGKLISSPGAIGDLLKQVAGGSKEEFQF